MSQVAVESGLGSVRAFAGDLHAFKAHFFFLGFISRGLGPGQILSSSESLVRVVAVWWV